MKNVREIAIHNLEDEDGDFFESEIDIFMMGWKACERNDHLEGEKNVLKTLHYTLMNSELKLIPNQVKRIVEFARTAFMEDLRNRAMSEEEFLEAWKKAYESGDTYKVINALKEKGFVR